jgi:hypothetical protein
MKFPFLFTFIVSAHISIAQVNGPEINSNSNTNTNNTFNSPSLNELREVEIQTIQEDLEFEQQTIEDNKNKDFKKLEKSRSDDFNSLDDNTDGISLTESNISDLSIRMDELLFDIKFNNTRKTPTSEQNRNMINLLKQYEKINNQSFEFNYFTYIAGNYDVEKVDCLKKAEALKPQNTDVHIQLAAYYFIKDDTDSTAMYLQKLVDVNRIDSTALIYGKDLLSSVTDNGVLFTHGFDDSYACAYLQKVENFRNDVTLLPFDFFQSSFFLDRIKKSTLVLSNSKIIDNEYFKYLILNNKNKNIHISVSFPIDYVLLFENSFYIKGLTFILENNQNELINGNINFYESISKNLILNANSDKSKELSVNYLPVLFLLKDWYKSAGNDSKVTELDDLIKKIAIQSGNYEKIKQIKD